MHWRSGAVLVAVVGIAGCGSATGRTGSSPAVPQARVPKLIGIEAGAANRRAASAGMVMRWRAFAGRAANGRYVVDCLKVHAQAPAAGELRPRGTVIEVVERSCTVPTRYAWDLPGHR